MEDHLEEKVAVFVAHPMQRFGPVLSALALRTPNETCKVLNARRQPPSRPIRLVGATPFWY